MKGGDKTQRLEKLSDEEPTTGEGAEREVTPVMTPVTSETEATQGDGRSKKRRKVDVTPQEQKKEKPRKFEMRVSLKDVDAADPDELLARQLQLEEEEKLELERAKAESQNEGRKSRAMEGVETGSQAGSMASRKRRAATVAQQNIRAMADDDDSEGAIARLSVTKDLFGDQFSPESSGMYESTSGGSNIDPNVSASSKMTSRGRDVFKRPPQMFRGRSDRRSDASVKVSSHNTYQGSTPTTGFVPRLDRKLFDELENQLASPLTSTELGMPIAESVLHSKISDKLTEANEEACAKIGRTQLEMPSHLGDGLFQFWVTRAHVSPNNQMPINAAPKGQD